MNNDQLHIDSVDIYRAIENNHQLKVSSNMPKGRYEFFRLLSQEKNFDSLVRKNLPKQYSRQTVKKILNKAKFIERRDKLTFGITILEEKKIIVNKLYIITNSTFPYGNANSNYIRYFALALYEKGWNVIVIGSNMSGKTYLSGVYKGIKYQNIQFSRKKLPFHLQDHFAYGCKLRKIMDEINIEEDSYVFVYSMYRDLVKTVLEKTQHLNEGHLSTAMVEWFQPFQYRFGKLNPDYMCWKYTFENLVTQFPKVFPISRKIQKYYEDAACQTMLLPIMADTSANNFKLIDRRDEEPFHFIYPGDAGKKDSLDGMMYALDSLTDVELASLRFHFTILKKNIIQEYVKKGINVERILSSMVFHGRLPYEDLLKLYKKMDFLFIAREKNIVTLSNFPSKIPELLSYGIIPVCSNVGDYADLYLKDRENSIIFEGANKEGCLDGIRRAINIRPKEIRKMRKNARICAEKNFDYHNWSEKIEKFLKA